MIVTTPADMSHMPSLTFTRSSFTNCCPAPASQRSTARSMLEGSARHSLSFFFFLWQRVIVWPSHAEASLA